LLCHELQQLGCNCWHDQSAEDVTKSGMEHGVADSEVFVLFLTDGVMERPFVQLEVAEALRLQKRIILLHEEVRTIAIRCSHFQ
jgi:hypothetical protein